MHSIAPTFYAGPIMRYSDTVNIARVFLAAGDLALKDGKEDLAERHYKRAESILAQAIPQSGAAHALPALRLSELYCTQNRLTEAITHANSAVGILTATLGISHPSTALAMHHLAEVLELQKLNSVAKAVRRRSAQMLKEAALNTEEPPKADSGDDETDELASHEGLIPQDLAKYHSFDNGC